MVVPAEHMGGGGDEQELVLHHQPDSNQLSGDISNEKSQLLFYAADYVAISFTGSADPSGR